MKPRQMLVTADKYWLKCPHAMTPKYITIHNTANDASANNEISYMRTNTTSTSFHFAVDDIEVVQGLPLNRNGWHSGDGSGTGNRQTIGIEICYSLSGGSRFTKAEQNAAKFTAQLLKERGWGVDRIKKHQDWSGKYCPHRTLDLGWARFVNMVKAHMTAPAPTPKPTIPASVKLPKPLHFTAKLSPTNVWDLTTYPNWKAKTTLKKGEGFRAFATITFNKSLYYVTEYSHTKGIKAGVNKVDLAPVVAPTPTPTPTPVPVPTEKQKFIAYLENRVKLDTEYINKLKGEK